MKCDVTKPTAPRTENPKDAFSSNAFLGFQVNLICFAKALYMAMSSWRRFPKSLRKMWDQPDIAAAKRGILQFCGLNGSMEDRKWRENGDARLPI